MIVGMIGVPTAANIVFLVRFLGDQSNLRVIWMRGEEAVDVYVSKSLGKGDMILFAGVLISKKDDAVFPQKHPQFVRTLRRLET